MNVTALLNGGISAVDQQKNTETFRLPTRSRTPWDAGGYSLPLNLAATSKDASPPCEVLADAQHESNHGSTMVDSSISKQSSVALSSPNHKFTDSRSSLSSFASSSVHSAGHSRYSSISTLNSPRTLSASLSEQLQLSPKATTGLGSLAVCQNEKVEQQGSSDALRSPVKSLETLALIAEHHSSEDSELATEHGKDESSARFENPAVPSRPQHHRSISNEALPSLGFIAGTWKATGEEPGVNHSIEANSPHNEVRSCVNDIQRPSSPSDTLLIKRPAIPSLHLDTQDQGVSMSYMAEARNVGRTHKRAVSAPNFAAMNIRPRQMPIVHEPTPPASNHPDHNSPPSNLQISPPATPPNAHANTVNTEPTCMYIDDCDTDSPQRKAISHIFGRNKMCTRQIPERLWVHLCRKHYQRCRYRDANKWAKVQCDLVQIQIRRIHEWSMSNQVDGEGDGIVLQSWSLALRKREKMRREIIENNKRKRGASSLDDNEDLDRDDSEHSSTQTKVPDWLVDHCGREFDTQGILEIFNRLHQDVLDGHVGPQFPDIELLPNLLLPEDAPTKKTAAPKARKVHQRSQSLNTHSHESKFRDHAQKRRRPNDEILSGRVLHSLPAPRGVMRRPTYPSIHEYDETSEQTYAPVDYQQRIMTPQPRRVDGPSMAAHFESPRFHPSGRPMHQRSQSDVTAFSYGRPEYAHPPTNTAIQFQVPAYGDHREMGYQPRPYRDEESSFPQESFEDRSRAVNGQDRFQPRDRQYSIPEDDIARYRQYNASPEGHIHVERDHSRFGHSRHNSTPVQLRSQYPTPPQYSNTIPPHQSPVPFVSQNERYNAGLSRSRELRDVYVARR